MAKVSANLVFMSQVGPAECECHKGKFNVAVNVVSPNGQSMTIGNGPMVDTAAEAENHREQVTEEIATAWVKLTYGLDVKDKKNIRFNGFDEARAEVGKFIRSTDPKLH